MKKITNLAKRALKAYFNALGVAYRGEYNMYVRV